MGARVGYDVELASRYFPPLVAILSGPEATDLSGATGVYFRTFEREGGRRAILYVLHFEHQSFPPHRWDYEPILVFLDPHGRVEKVIYDGFHYIVDGGELPARRRPDETPAIAMVFPWRAFRFASPEDFASGVVVTPDELGGLRPLTDATLDEWRARQENPCSIAEVWLTDPWSSNLKTWSGRGFAKILRRIAAVSAEGREGDVVIITRKYPDGSTRRIVLFVEGGGEGANSTVAAAPGEVAVEA